MLDEVYEEYALHMSEASKVYFFFVVIEVSVFLLIYGRH